MTNDLFRELLEGKIPTPARQGTRISPELITEWASWTGVGLTPAQALFMNQAFRQPRIIMGAELAADPDTWDKPVPTLTSYHAYYQTTEPSAEMRALIYGVPKRSRDGYSITKPIYDETNPRERALRAKQHRGTGPEQTPLRVRGRTTHYREKG